MSFVVDGGEVIPQGTHEVPSLPPFIGKALPDWLTFGSSGSDAGSAIASSLAKPPAKTIVTATTIGSTATLYGEEFTLAGEQANALHVTWTGGQTAHRGISFGLIGANDGMWVQQISETDTTLRLLKAGVASSASTDWDMAFPIGRFNLTLLVTHYDASLFLLEGDESHSAWEKIAGGFGSGVVRPFIRVTNRTGTYTELVEGVPVAAGVSIDVQHVSFTRIWY